MFLWGRLGNRVGFAILLLPPNCCALTELITVGLSLTPECQLTSDLLFSKEVCP